MPRFRFKPAAAAYTDITNPSGSGWPGFTEPAIFSDELQEIIQSFVLFGPTKRPVLNPAGAPANGHGY
jgi:hypothetical protein